MDNEFIPITKKDTFQFKCGKDLACFNTCCKDLNQILTPFDIIQLKNYLNISSQEFLEAYTYQSIGPETGLPIVSLKPDRANELACPFLVTEGCRVYEARPSSCRIYPIARAISRSRATQEITENYAILKESHCQGFQQKELQTVTEWNLNQGLSVYFKMNDLMIELISLKQQLYQGPLDMTLKHAFNLALYNIDLFRTKIYDDGFLDDQLDEYKDLFEQGKTDDGALLIIGMGWMKQKLIENGKTNGI